MDYVHPNCANGRTANSFRRIKMCDRDRVFVDLYNFVLNQEIEKARILGYVELLGNLQLFDEITLDDSKLFFDRTRSDYISDCILANYMDPIDYGPNAPLDRSQKAPEFFAIELLAETFGFTRRTVHQLLSNSMVAGPNIAF